MSALGPTLRPLEIESNDRTVSLRGSYFASSAWTLHTEFRHQETDGTNVISGSFLTEAVQLPQPIEYVTNTVEAGATWTSRHASLRLIYTGSWFQNDIDSLTFANPYLPLVPGSTRGRLALPPDNNLQQVSATGTFLPGWLGTSLNYAFSLGTLRQDDAFLPYSTLPGRDHSCDRLIGWRRAPVALRARHRLTPITEAQSARQCGLRRAQRPDDAAHSRLCPDRRVHGHSRSHAALQLRLDPS